MRLLEFDYYERVKITVVQPRAFDSQESIKSWYLGWDDLADWADKFKSAIARTIGSTEVNKGSWCKYCDALAHCPAMKKEIAPQLEAPIKDVRLIPIESCAKVVANESLIKDFIKACQSRIEMEMLDFKMPVDGFKIVKKRSMKAWDDQSEAARELLEEYDEDVLFTKKFKTPNQLIKTIGEETIKPYLRG